VISLIPYWTLNIRNKEILCEQCGSGRKRDEMVYSLGEMCCLRKQWSRYRFESRDGSGSFNSDHAATIVVGHGLQFLDLRASGSLG
jgi:hypothetical protein